MPRLTKEAKKEEFKKNYQTLKESPSGQEAYKNTFKDQSRGENLLAADDGEDFGTLEEELSSLSAMNAIRQSQRKQAFTQEMLFDEDIELGVRDASYVDASAEIRRRKAIKSHRWDKTRRSRMETSRETLEEANDKIRSLKARLQPAQGARPMTVIQRVEALKKVYDQIRIADRNCAEAIALSEEEEEKLKDKAELTYCSSLKRMLEREMAALDPGSREYAKLNDIYQLNQRNWNKLMKPVLEQKARAEEEEARRDLNRRDEENQQQAPVLMDPEAEALVSANVRMFGTFCGTLNDRKYGAELDELWSDMKNKADALKNGWEQKTDLERGDALASLLVAANRLLCKEGPKTETDKARESAAKQYRSFFKSVLEGMSRNCRVLALERIFQKVDEMDDDPQVSKALKRANASIFAELGRERYRKENPDVEEKDDALKLIDDLHYRNAYALEKMEMHIQNVKRYFANTKEYMLAMLKFNFARMQTYNLIAEDFRVDRFGNVLQEDAAKKEQWKTLIGEIAAADGEKALELSRRFIIRAGEKPVDPAWVNEKGFNRNIYEVISFSKGMNCMQDCQDEWKAYDEEDVRNRILQWNQEHPEDLIPEDSIKDPGINKAAILAQGEELRKLPSIKAREDAQIELEYNYFNKRMPTKGIIYWDNDLKIHDRNRMRMLYQVRKFMKDPREVCPDDPDIEFANLIHRDGTAFDPETDVDNRGRLIYNAQNPLVYEYEQKKPEVYRKLKEQKDIGYLNDGEKHGDVVKRVDARLSLFTKTEADAMDKLRSLTLGKGDPGELAALEQLYNEYMAELKVQAIAAETLFQADLDCKLDDINSGYYKEAQKYYKQKKKINDLFDRLEAARDAFLTKNAGKEAFDGWKSELEEKRKEARGALQQIEKENTTAFDRVKKAFVSQAAIGKAEGFTDEEFAAIQSQDPNKVWSGQEKEQILEPFILHVERDFSGAYLTERDKYNADYNKRFKEAMLQGNAEVIKDLSREFVEKTLPLADYVDPEGIEEITAEGIEEKYIITGKINFKRIKLCMISNVDHDSNTNFPLLRTGFTELKDRDPERYRDLSDKLSIADDSLFNQILQKIGYNTEHLIPVDTDEAKQEVLASVIHICAEELRIKTNAIKERERERIRQAPETELLNTKNRIAAKSAQKAKQLDKAEEERVRELIKNAEFQDTRGRILSGSAGKVKKIEEAEEERRGLLLMLGNYEALDRPDAKPEEGFALKEKMVTTLTRLTGVDRSLIEFTPTDRLVQFISDAAGRNPDYKKLAEDIKALDDLYSSGKGEEELVKRAEALLAKGEDMTAQDKLLLYDLNALLIACNRNAAPDEDPKDDLHYDDFKNHKWELPFMTRYARQVSDFRRLDLDGDEEYDKLDEKRSKKLRSVALEMLSDSTGKDIAFFEVLPLEELTGFAFDVHDILHKKKSEDAKKECFSRIKELERRIKLLDDAAESYDRKKLSVAVSELTGMKTEDFHPLLTTELFDLAVSLRTVVFDKVKMKKGAENALGLASKLHTTEFFRSRSYKAFEELLRQERENKEADERSRAVWKELAVRYLISRLGRTDLTDSDFENVDPELLSRIMGCPDIILAYRENPPQDETEKEDLNMAIRSIAKISDQLSENARTAFESVLGLDFAAVSKEQQTTKTKDQFQEMEQSDVTWEVPEEHKGSDIFTELLIPAYAKSSAALKKGLGMEDSQSRFALGKMMNRTRQIYWNKENLEIQRRKKSKKNEINEEQLRFSEKAVKTKDLFAGLIMALSDNALDSSLKNRVKAVLKEHAEVFGYLASSDETKGSGYVQIFTELKNGASEQEKQFMSACEDSLSEIMKLISTYQKEQKPDAAFGAADFKNLLKGSTLDAGIDALSEKLPKIVDALEKEVVPLMESSVRSVFGQDAAAAEEEDKDYVIFPHHVLGFLNISDEDLDAMNAKKQEVNKKEARTIRDMVKFSQKSDEQVEIERKKLEKLDQDVRFDPHKGQGRFIQLLISNYYREANGTTKRRMLSHIIRDMKRDTAAKKKKEAGCAYFASAIKGAGPVMQKMIQGVPERLIVDEMSEALSIVKSSLPSIDKEYVNRVWKDLEENGKLKILNVKSLGAASVAETFECEILDKKKNQRTVVVKILRPDAKERMAEEIDFIKRMAMYADMTEEEVKAWEKKTGKKYDPNNHRINVTESGFLAQFAEIEKEFDFSNEVKNCKLGKERYVDRYYDKKKGHPRRVNSVIIDKTNPKGKNYLIMNKAEGETADKIIQRARASRKSALDAFKNENKLVAEPFVVNVSNVGSFWDRRNNMFIQMAVSIPAAKLLRDLTYVWIEQALFGNLTDKENFHHGDMHAGNIMIDLKKDESTVLDYGNAVLLNSSRINAILNMMTAVVVNRADCFVENFNALLKYCKEDEAKAKEKVGYQPMTEKEKTEFKKKLGEVFELGDARDTGKKILIALNMATELGIKLPKEIQNFSQCQQRLENTLNDMKNEAIRLCENIQFMENLPVSEEDQDSVDPLIRLHQYWKKKKVSDIGEEIDHIGTFLKQYELLDFLEIISKMKEIESQEMAEKFMETVFPEYATLTADYKPEEMMKAADRLLNAFEPVYEIQKTGKEVPKDLRDELRKVQKEISVIIFGEQVFYSMTKGLDLDRALGKLWSEGKTDRGAFDLLYHLLKYRIPAVMELGDKAMELGSIRTKIREGSLKDRDVEDNALKAANRALGKAMDETDMENPAAFEFLTKLHTLDRKEFERQTARMNERTTGLAKGYKAVRKAEEELLTAKGKGDSKAIEECRRKLEHAENEYVKDTMLFNHDEISGVFNSFQENLSTEDLKNDREMQDFTEVMGDVCGDKFIRAGLKLDWALNIELASLQSLQKLEEKMIAAQELALRKGDPKSLEKAKEIQEEFKKEVAKREAEKKQKLEELAKKAEEAQKKEEEKKQKELAKQLKKAEEAKKKEAARKKKEEAKKKKK